MSKTPKSQPPAVLHLISSLGVGGAERMLVNLAKSFTELRPFTQIVVVMNDHIDRKLATELNSTSVPVYYLGRPPGSKNPRYIFDLVKIIRAHHVNIIHSHNGGSKHWSMLCRVATFKTKLVFTFHHTEINMSFIDIMLHNAMIDTTIAISRAVARELHSLKIDRVAQIENGLPISLFQSIFPQPFGSKVKIISVGRLSLEKKGQDILIRALKLCVDRGLDIDCTLVGTPTAGDSQTLPMLQGLVSSLQLTGRVHFLQGRSDVATLLGQADLFVLPSRHEGFGLALVEALAAGLPVIASNTDGPADIISDGVDGLLFESGSDEQLAEKIEILIQSPVLARHLSINGRAKSTKYDISTMRDRYFEVYQSLVSDDRYS